MKTNRIIFFVFAISVTALIAYITVESFSGRNLNQFEGKLEEMDFYRNENNTGPVLRIYAVKVYEADQEMMQEYAKLMPHTKYGRTMVFFFSDKIEEQVKVGPKEPYFDPVHNPFLLASFLKTPMSEERFNYLGND
ncbi:hypothetical protein [Algoriphagus hitonicola]|uniref:Uncharacterized protein n=1 Tax=Algoriphagus hitonicola TaxID=435880 RepID=A0A1I2X1C3_9BACT|nr:hypothetical protein [Algoriphagus hitonicola]SFH06679.1 hypothetical protein SAMN04487988_11539 [Algoriphagus hitonicola]